ncbi:MAG: hypothetical protein ACR2L6_01000 [Gemmatimonadaceae bacterium]
MYMVFGTWGSYFVFERHSDPQSKFSTPRPTGLESSGGGNVSIALDGRSFSFVNSYCTPPRGLYIGCETYQFLIYHADAVVRGTKRLAVHSTFGGDAIVSISPDGRRIAYTLDRLLYVLTAN